MFAARIRIFTIATLCSLTLLTGCMTPGMYYGAPYGQPMYAPPQMLNQSSPGTLVIPESGGTPYEPGSTYDTDPNDDFQRSDDDQFYSPDDGAPLPRDLNDDRFDSDLGGPSTSLQHDRSHGQSDQIQLASHVTMPQEYGFDTAGYQWLRGRLRYLPEHGAWGINYSLAANDRYRGSLLLDVAPDQVQGLSDGDAVDVHGHVTPNADSKGTPIYKVDSIRSLTGAAM